MARASHIASFFLDTRTATPHHKAHKFTPPKRASTLTHTICTPYLGECGGEVQACGRQVLHCMQQVVFLQARRATRRHPIVSALPIVSQLCSQLRPKHLDHLSCAAQSERPCKCMFDLRSPFLWPAHTPRPPCLKRQTTNTACPHYPGRASKCLYPLCPRTASLTVRRGLIGDGSA